MQGKKVLLVFSALLCLLPMVAASLFAQQPDSPATKRASPTKQTGAALEPDAHRVLREAQQHCRELLKPIEGLKHLRGFEQRAEADKIWDSFFAAKSEAELASAEIEFRDCVVELPNVAIRRDAFQAYRAIIDYHELDRELSARSEVEEQEQKKQQALVDEINKKQSKLSDAQASFAEAANFAVTLYKQREEYKEAYEGEVRAYGRLSDLTDQVLALAKQVVNRPSGPSWEALVNPPKPQIIRIETPAVPRALYCASSTMPPAAPGLETWTWTNCHW